MSTPLIRLKVEPRTRADETRLRAAVSVLERQDPLFSASVDPESGEIILGGHSERHLDSIVQRLIDDFQVNSIVGAPQVAYRETLTAAGEAEFTHDHITDSSRQFARVKLRVEPLERGAGNVFESAFRDHPKIRAFSAVVAKGVASVFDNGVLIGFPIVDTKVSWIDGSYHETRSTAADFEITARGAMLAACKAGHIAILEPIMQVEVSGPTDFERSILLKLDARRGQILEQSIRDGKVAISANVPLANMFGFNSELERLSNRQAMHSMSFSHYQLLPRNITGEDPDNFPPSVGMRA